jgi:hypothetical protein
METRQPEKAPSGFAKLSLRERTMIFVLAIVAIAGVMGYFLLWPMMTEYGKIQTEIEDLENREIDMRMQIEQKDAYQKAYNEALVQYNQYSQYFYRPIDPEMLDELITGLTLASGLSPRAFSMSQLQVEGIPLYSATELAPHPVPEPTIPAEGGDGQDGSAEGDGTADGDGTETAPAEPAPPTNTSSYVYNAHIAAEGPRTAFYDLLARVQAMDAIEVLRFDYTDPETIKAPEGSNEKDKVTPGRLNIDFKVYVFIEGMLAQGGM